MSYIAISFQITFVIGLIVGFRYISGKFNQKSDSLMPMPNVLPVSSASTKLRQNAAQKKNKEDKFTTEKGTKESFTF